MPYKIYGEGHDVMLEITDQEGWRLFSITLEPVTEGAREWFAEHLDRAFKQATSRAGTMAVNRHNATLRGMLGVR